MTKHSRVVRGAVLLSSGSIAALLVSHGVPGCDRPPEPKVEAGKAEAKAEVKPEAKAEAKPEVKAEAKPEAPPEPKKDAPTKVAPEKVEPLKGESGLNNANKPNYFPASKAGVFIERVPDPPPQQQAPQQQAGPQ